MFHVIPGNRLELLVEPLKLLLAMEKQHVLSSDWILLPHRGMQHWLSMELANSRDRQISMNLDMHLPASGIWALIHKILGKDTSSQATEWRRESLSWKLYYLLDSPELTDHVLMQEPTAYWRSGSQATRNLKRYQLAEQIADLFEQYLIYRPDWIQQWQQGSAEHWQALLWQKLVMLSGHHPLGFMQEALDKIHTPASKLPERIFIFAVNNLAPMWLDFLKQISDQSDIDFHIFYLNPSDEYWGDQVSEKQAARLRANWFDKDSEELLIDTGNVLLSSLGSQGQAFVHLLSEKADIETPVFTDSGTDTYLHSLQHDLLNITDQSREFATNDSIHIVSAYSPLREVQGLHDWLLDQFEQNADLKPRDILVMCPEIERYAPYVEAVFARGYDHLSDRLPPLPCSISDRGLVSSDPLVSTFVSFLELPDSRLQVSQIMTWLNVPAIQQQFGFSQDTLDKIEGWLFQSHIHWGADADHKQRVLGSLTGGESEQLATDTYTWKLGLERLLLGFAWGDEETLVGERLMLPPVEGSDALLLGQLIAFIDQLRLLTTRLNTSRSAEQWVKMLRDDILYALLSEQSGSRSFQIIDQCLTDLVSRIEESGVSQILELSSIKTDTSDPEKLDASIIRYYLQQELNRPETTANQYLMGQITFCSMVPMRSVPFKVIAVLGLNEGDYPRQRQPVGFDLMAAEPPRKGDRSRRGDDRYLFLETLMSARDQLYLSYQGHSIHNNTEKQPSLLLEELMDYLQSQYGWDRKTGIHQLPMQSFSPLNYPHEKGSFDPVGFRLITASQDEKSRLFHSTITVQDSAASSAVPSVISANQLIQFFDHPSAFFAKQGLGLYFDHYAIELQDIEPFAANNLHRYQIQQEIIEALNDSDGDPAAVEWVAKKSRLSGLLPEIAPFSAQLTSWEQQSTEFFYEVNGIYDMKLKPQQLSFEFQGKTIMASLPINDQGELQYWRLADPKPKDYLRLWINQLIAQVAMNQSCTSSGLYRNKTEFSRVTLAPIADAEAILSQWIRIFETGQLQPMLFNAAIGIPIAASNKPFQSLWESTNFKRGLDADPYLAYFWASQPGQDDIDACVEFYQPMIASFQKDGKGVKM